MSDDVIQRLFDKIDDLSKRLTKIETILEEREKNQKNHIGIIAWVVTTAIAIYGVFRGHSG